MMVLGCFVLGALAAAGLWRLLRPVFAAPVFTRTNYRGASVPVGAGVVLATATAASVALAALVADAGSNADGVEARLLTMTVVLGFSFLGLFDDLAGTSGDRGFKGHVRALATGRLTTGGLKLVGGGVLALAVVASMTHNTSSSTWLLRVLVDAAVVALAANVGNLFDLAPGRVTKVALVCFVGLGLVTQADPNLSGAAVVVGAAVGLLWPDLREELMLGDAGANPLGAALGLAVVLTTGAVTRDIVCVVLVVLNVLSERVSFSRVINQTPGLRALDRLGRRPPD